MGRHVHMLHRHGGTCSPTPFALGRRIGLGRQGGNASRPHRQCWPCDMWSLSLWSSRQLLSCPVFWPICLLTMSLSDSPKRQGHWIFGFLATRPLPQVLTSAVCVWLPSLERGGKQVESFYTRPHSSNVHSLDQKQITQMLA